MKRTLKSAFSYTFSRLKWMAILFFLIWVHTVDVSEFAGRINPAAAPMTLTYAFDGAPVKVNGEFQPVVIFGGMSERLRSNCSPRRMEWFLGEREGRNVPLPNWQWGKPRVNPDSVFEFGPWSVTGVTTADFMIRVFGDVVHQCGVKIGKHFIPFPWETRSRFWN